MSHTKDLGITWSIWEQDKESGFANVLYRAVDASFAMCQQYFAVCDLTFEVRYLRQLAKGLGFEQKEQTLCFEDNKEAIMTTENECSVAGHMKHVDVKFRFFQESIKMEEIRIRYISTELNWEDVLTKALVLKKHKDAIESIIGSKETYRLVVSEKGTLIQYADSYFMLAYF